MKLILDIFISLILIIFLSPIFILISILIFFESGFPIIHKRLVHSQPTKLFHFYKFRTMYNNADEKLKILLKNDKKLEKEFNEFYKLRKDPRITRLGKLLRKSSLDELPQLFNVLFCQMSLVGPRPKTSEELKKYFNKSSYDILFKVKPGITCTWQISGRSNIDYSKRVELDLNYAENRNLFIDFKILFLTIFALFRKGAR